MLVNLGEVDTVSVIEVKPKMWVVISLAKDGRPISCDMHEGLSRMPLVWNECLELKDFEGGVWRRDDDCKTIWWKKRNTNGA